MKKPMKLPYKCTHLGCNRAFASMQGMSVHNYQMHQSTTAERRERGRKASKSRAKRSGISIEEMPLTPASQIPSRKSRVGITEKHDVPISFCPCCGVNLSAVGVALNMEVLDAH